MKTLVPLKTSGEITTTTDAAKEMISVPAGARYSAVLFSNYSLNDAYVSIDAGTTWIFLGAGETKNYQDVEIFSAVQVKNVDAGSNVTVTAEIT